MTFSRRMALAGLPAAGVTVLAALALGGSPATASNEPAARPVLAVTPCADSARECTNGYGTSTGPVATLPTRGQGGYGSESPTTAPTPTISTDTVPPGVSPSSASPTPTPGVTTRGGGVSAGHALALTGPPTGAIVSFGVLLVAAGAASVWYTRRKRTA